MNRDIEEYYNQYGKKVYAYLLSICREPDTAQELTQETFCQAIKSLSRADNWLTAMKMDVDQTYSGEKVSATVGFRPCLPFRQDMNRISNKDGMVWSAPLVNIGEGSTLTIHCSDKNIVLDLYKLSEKAE